MEEEKKLDKPRHWRNLPDCVDGPLFEYVRKHAKKMPTKVAVNYYGREVTYKELDESSDRLATAIADMGYKKGDRVVAFMQSSPHCYIFYLAALKLGLVIVPIDPMFKERELEYALHDTEAKMIITFDQLYPVVEAVKDKCEVKDIIITSFHDYLPDNPTIPLHKMMEQQKRTFAGTHEFLELLERYQPNPPKVDIELSDYAWILHTGGTTGYPKGCVHTQYNTVLGGLGNAELAYDNATPDDVVLVSYPHTHISGISHAFTPALITGMTAIPLARWDPDAAMEAIQRYKVTLIYWPMPCYWAVINHPRVKEYDLTSLRTCLITPFVMPIVEEAINKWKEITHSTAYDFGYAGSEQFNYCCYGTGLTFPRPTCVTFGRPAPGVQIKIMDFETREEVLEGEEGEIVTNQPAQLKFYWNKPEENKRDIVDGWVHTNDRGYLKDGVLYFLGKASDVVKVSGYTVGLKEVELIGSEHPAIDKIAVVGIPGHPKKGNQLKAFVVLKPGTETSAHEIEEWFKEGVATFKQPIVETVEDLPLSGKGEVLKRVLLEEELKKQKKGA